MRTPQALARISHTHKPPLFTNGWEARRREAASALDSMCYKNREHLPAITSEVEITDAPFSFNRSIRIRSRRDRITGDSGAPTGRELLRRSRVVRFCRSGCRTSGTGAGSGIRKGGWRGRCFAGGAGPPGAQRRHGAAGRSGAAASHRRPGGHGSDGSGPGACPRSRRCRGGWRRGRRRKASRCCARGCSGWRGVTFAGHLAAHGGPPTAPSAYLTSARKAPQYYSPTPTDGAGE